MGGEGKRRFNITWREGRYTCSIPEYCGGEVVDAKAYDKSQEVIRGLVKAGKKSLESSGAWDGDGACKCGACASMRTAIQKAEESLKS